MSADYQMTLEQLLPERAAALAHAGHLGLCVSGLAVDSRQVVPGDLFVACQGANSNGVDFIDDAVARGAQAVLVNSEQRVAGCPVPLIAVDNLEQRLAELGGRFYHQPSASLNMVGITGTNGKTSCSHFIAQALNRLGSPAAVVGTIGSGFPGRLERATHTTPDALSLQRLLAQLRLDGAEGVVMEVSSHALDQGRVEGVQFDQVVFTNLTRDHLDYHGDMAQYAAAKMRLFTEFNCRQAIINLDDPFAAQLLQGVDGGTEVIGYSMRQDPAIDTGRCDRRLWAEQVTLSAAGIKANLSTAWGPLALDSEILGRFNLANLMATAAVLLARGYKPAQLQPALSALTGVEGRMQPIVAAGKPLVVVDYAHTPDALEKALIALREHCKGRLWCLFGCGGDRDTGKRSAMGAIAERSADRALVTSDNPRSEEPGDIIEDILSGVCRREAMLIEPDRRQALAMALKEAAPEDVILVAGKGHEDYQEIKGVRYPFSDAEIIAELMNAGRGGADA